MTHCAKCGAAMAGAKKFCIACGTPAGDPRSPAASTGALPATNTPSSPGSSGPVVQYAPAPGSQVNPFAATTGPGGTAPAADYGPPPSVPLEFATTAPNDSSPSRAPKVSPLATSAVDSARSIKGGVPSTVQMPSLANPNAGASAAPRPDRTQVLGAFPGVPVAPSTAGVSSLGPTALAPPLAPAYAPPPAPAAGYGLGSRVNVAWSNGQHYPGTVSQIAGSQCLVVFPDGQQLWVERQYITPG